MKSVLGTLVVAGALLASPAALGEDAKESAPASETAKPAPAGETSGKAAARMIVAKDPETGRLRPATAKEIEALAAAGAQPALAGAGETTFVETLPSGRIRARLGPEFIRYELVRKNPDGSLSVDGLRTSKKADRAVTSPAPGAAPAAVEK